MRRTALLLFLVSAGTISTACGDPIVVLGESPGTVRNVAGVGDSTGTRVDSIATRTRLQNATAVAFDDETTLLYVADRGSNTIVNNISSQVARIFSVTSAGKLRLVLDAGGCTAQPVCVGEVTDMIDAGTTLLIADQVRHRVSRFDPASRTLTLVAGTGTPTAAVEGATAATSSINAPGGLEIGGDGTIYVSERGAGRIISIGTNGQYHVVAGGGTTTITTTPVNATSARLVAPAGLALANGVLYIADNAQHSVYALTIATNQIVRIAGDGISGFSGDNDLAVNARLASPNDVAMSDDGTLLYIADTGSNRVRTWNRDSGVIRTYIGSGSTVYNGDRLAAGAASLKSPINLELSALGFIFVVDQGHAIVRRATIAF